MTDHLALSVRQQQDVVATAAPLYVQACPGSGKTHTIVTRHVQAEPPTPRQGRALISFTRNARNQLLDRCTAEGRRDLSGYPHFIGTLDQFLWAFLVEPFLAQPEVASQIESWRSISASRVELGKRSVGLGAFTFGFDPTTGTEIVRAPTPPSVAGRQISDSFFAEDKWLAAALATRDRWRREATTPAMTYG